MKHVVFAGTKPFAIYETDEPAQAAGESLEAAGVQAAITVSQVIDGTVDDFAKTCDDYLKGKDAIISEVVSLLDA